MKSLTYAAVAATTLVAAVGATEAAGQSDTATYVPQRLLGLVHAPEVHDQLTLSSPQVSELEGLFAEIDGEWFRSRLLPLEQQREAVARLEQRVQQWFSANTSADQQQRLRQLERQAQGVRMMLRDDVQRAIKLTPNQREQFVGLAAATQQAQAALQEATAGGEPSDELKSAVEAAAKRERTALKSVLSTKQHEALWRALGEPFDTSKLTRIYPMATEFIPVDNWINSSPLTLEGLRGKVVLVHFYAFQCHNCHANFDIYRRWHEQLAEKGVVVIGIQTPETSDERDPAAVRAAAAERDLTFPIMVDLKSKNWQAWGNTMWPTVYVVDKNGYLRHWWQGELQWKGATGDQTIEAVVQQALQEETVRR